jgi:hypothetical protein
MTPEEHADRLLRNFVQCEVMKAKHVDIVRGHVVWAIRDIIKEAREEVIRDFKERSFAGATEG